MQTTYVPPELSTNGRCGFVVGNLPTCANRRMRGGKYCKRANDQEGYAVTVKKDPRNFLHSPLYSRSTKAIPL